MLDVLERPAPSVGHWSIARLSEHLDVNPATVRRWIHDGQLQAFQLPGGFWRIPVDEVARLTHPGGE